MTGGADERELVRRLEHAVARMPGTTRAVFLLHRLLGLGYGEIGARLGLATGEVERHISAAMLHLACELEDGEGRGTG